MIVQQNTNNCLVRSFRKQDEAASKHCSYDFTKCQTALDWDRQEYNIGIKLAPQMTSGQQQTSAMSRRLYSHIRHRMKNDKINKDD